MRCFANLFAGRSEKKSVSLFNGHTVYVMEKRLFLDPAGCRTKAVWKVIGDVEHLYSGRVGCDTLHYSRLAPTFLRKMSAFAAELQPTGGGSIFL
jgi:hypothetical protein